MAVHLPEIASAALFLVFCVVVSKIVYRRLFHSLRAFPGPWLNSVSAIPGSIALATGVQNTYNYRLHAKYGAVVRVAPNELIFASPDAYEAIYGLRQGRPMEKSPTFLGLAKPLQGYVGLGLADRQTHARQRRQLAPSMSKTALQSQESILRTHVDKLIAVLHQVKDNNEQIDVSAWWSFFSFDVAGDISFAASFGCLDKGSLTTWALAINNVLISATWTQAIRRVTGVGNWMEKLVTKCCVPSVVMEWHKTHFLKTKEKVQQRLAAKDSSHPDVIYHLLRSETEVPVPEIILNMALFLGAGTETTAILLTAWTYLVCTHPEAYKRVVAEVRGAFNNEEEMDLNAVMSRLPFLEATINEALRLFPPAAVNIQRVVPLGGADIAGRFVPAGATVSVSPWATVRSPAEFHEPDEFHPERWLADCPAVFKQDNLSASQPFSVGPRKCMGMNLAEFEARLVLSRVIWNFDLELSEEKGRTGWTLDPTSATMTSYQALSKPDLWIRPREVR